MYKIFAQQAPAAMYSASAVDKATLFCLLYDQDIKDLLSKWHPSDVLFYQFCNWHNPNRNSQLVGI
jgi:hypothetical protein